MEPATPTVGVKGLREMIGRIEGSDPSFPEGKIATGVVGKTENRYKTPCVVLYHSSDASSMTDVIVKVVAVRAGEEENPDGEVMIEQIIELKIISKGQSKYK